VRIYTLRERGARACHNEARYMNRIYIVLALRRGAERSGVERYRGTTAMYIARARARPVAGGAVQPRSSYVRVYLPRGISLAPGRAGPRKDLRNYRSRASKREASAEGCAAMRQR